MSDPKLPRKDDASAPYQSVAAHVGPTPDGASKPGPPPGFSIYPDRNDLVLLPGDELREQLTATVTLPALVPAVDVYVLVDTTASMKLHIRGVRTVLREVFEFFRHKVPGAGNLAFGLGAYRDFPHDSFAFRHMLTPSRDVAQAVAAVSGLTVGGGEDGAEGQLHALDRLARDPRHWRRGSRRVVVWIGDAPGHDPIPAVYTQDGAEQTEESVTEALTTARIAVHAFSLPHPRNPEGLDGDPRWESGSYEVSERGRKGQATRICAATEGSHASQLEAAAIISLVEEHLNQTIDRIERLELVATGGASRFVRKVMPAGGYGPLTRPGVQPLEFVVDFLGTMDQGDEERRFEGELQVLADGAPVAAKVVHVRVPQRPAPEPEPAPVAPPLVPAEATRWSYSIKFLCGVQDADLKCCTPVRPGHYSTEINIHNYGPRAACVHQYVFPLVRDGREPGRAPASVGPTPCEELCLNGNSATMIDCCALSKAIDGRGELRPPLAIGILELVSNVPLSVTAVHTASGPAGGLTMDVQTVEGRPKPSDGVAGFEDSEAG